jgi:excinuclease UvrABC ATPase subunit
MAIAHLIAEVQSDASEPAQESAQEPWSLVIDRLTVKQGDDDFTSRLLDSVETAFFEGDGACSVHFTDDREPWQFSNRFERDGLVFPEPSPELFTFNSPIGACRRCEGFGHVIGIDPSRIVPDPRLSIYEDAIACWRGERMSKWKDRLCLAARDNGIPIHSPWRELTSTQQEAVWEGGKGFKGLNAFFKYLEEKSYKIQFRVMLSRYRGRTTCPECAGTRLGKASQNVFIGGKDLTHVLRMPAKDALVFFQSLSLTETQQEIAERLIQEIVTRPELPLRCRTWLPHIGSIQQNVKWRRIAAHCLEYLSGQQFGRKYLRLGRAKHRIASRRYRATHWYPSAIARYRQHCGRGGA